MSLTPLTASAIDAASVAALPSRPNAPVGFGGGGLTSAELRAAFDRLPRLVAEQCNALITGLLDGSLLAEIPTAIPELAAGHSLADLLIDLRSGDLAGYLATSPGSNLASDLAELFSTTLSHKIRLSAAETTLATISGAVDGLQNIVLIDGGTPATRA